MKARSSSKRWCAQKASSLFSFSLWSRDGVHTCIRWLGAKTWQTVGRITWHGSRATLSKEKLASGGNNINGFWWLMEAMDKEDRRHWEQRLWMSSLSLPASPCYRAFRAILCPVIVGGIGALYCASFDPLNNIERDVFFFSSFFTMIQIQV